MNLQVHSGKQQEFTERSSFEHISQISHVDIINRSMLNYPKDNAIVSCHLLPKNPLNCAQFVPDHSFARRMECSLGL